MTWEELKEKAKGTGYSLDVDYTGEEYLHRAVFCFRKSGAVDDGRFYANISRNRTPEQMLMIMRGLE